MTAPKASFQTNFGRFYAHPSMAVNPAIGYAPNPSITNIIGMMDKKFLPPWYAKLVAEYAVDHLDAIAWQVEKFGRDTAVGVLKSVPSRSNTAAAIGDEVHAAIDEYYSNGFDSPVFSTPTATAMFRQFREFNASFEPEILRTEYTVWSYRYGYAGTGDLLFRKDGKLWIVDTKTGKGIHPEVAMQTAAILNADVILEEDGTESPMPVADEIGVLHVRPRSARLYQLGNRQEAFTAFLACKTLFDWQRFHAESVIPAAPVFTTQRAVALCVSGCVK